VIACWADFALALPCLVLVLVGAAGVLRTASTAVASFTITDCTVVGVVHKLARLD
jgi:hypothetical protein